MLLSGICLLVILAGRECRAQVSGEFWWLNQALIGAAEEHRAGKRIDEENVRVHQDIGGSETSGADCSCVPACQCDDPPSTSTFFFDDSERQNSCSRPHEICCHMIRLPIPGNCSTTGIPSEENSVDRVEKRGSQPLKEFPWLLALSMDRTPNICGAAMLDSTTAITAAHCVSESKYPSSYSVRTIGGHDRIINEIIKHPAFYSGGRFSDIALLKWERPLLSARGSNTIEIAEDDDFNDENCSCFTLELNNERPVPVNVMSPFLCESILQNGRLGRRFQLHTSFLCTVVDLPVQCSLHGGNPLICQRDENFPLLAGLVSWGFNCHEPQIYTNVSVFSDWIHDHLEKYYFMDF